MQFSSRTGDGSCNSLSDPIMGRSMTPFRRLVPAEYADGIQEMRYSKSGGPLPSARVISKNLFPDIDLPSSKITQMFVYFGQFLDHDLTRTAITEILKNPDEDSQPGQEACWPIPVPEDDSDFAYNRCIKFVRAMEVPSLSCYIGPREQLNQPTHWLDASMIYGDTVESIEELRDHSDMNRGKMAVTAHPGSNFRSFLKPLPPKVEFDPLCREVNATVQCFTAGDERINENAGLGVIHIAWLRQHNRIEEELHRLNPHWSGEKLFYQTKKIMTAALQHVTYNEQVPVILGPHLVQKWNIGLKQDGYDYSYNSKVDARIPNSFATAAYRFGHTLLHERLERVDAYDHVDDSLFLSSTFHRPMEIYNQHKGGVDSFIRGLAQGTTQAYDQFFTKQITKSLFTDRPPFGPGMDLVSINMQRGRDHGLPGYNSYREWCGFGRAHSFDDLAVHVTDPRALKGLKTVYKHVDDIDLFAGGVSESPVPEGVVGPTFACIIGETFQKLKIGDRFWYEYDHKNGFTPAQLQQIRRITMARIMCVNGDNIQTIQPWAFLRPHTPNSL
ncbi:hypothetical protein CAPTEDRAFT_134931 [Capitella teleta]|uniref:Uncharacterized protein n=1 Tax=Capitella teleta TaxID=283909 RepID=R7TU77_CAPTE|nr:hypothetical protein CAPTEDRAFT_134931 [Capitella teleta]|eukprot:ELT97224.1 hypothetical protein CAPTEDRAFT_134931 [Capitella teleta]